MLLLVFLALFFIDVNVCGHNEYNREDLQQQYPGFGTEWIVIDKKKNGELVIGYLNDAVEGRQFPWFPEPADVVTFTLFTRKFPEGMQVNSSNVRKIFDKTKSTKFVTHGWMSDGQTDTCITIKDGFLKKYDANVFIVDWGEISKNKVYPIAMAATKSVGEFYSNFIDELIGFGADPKQMHLVGHSLGAHVSGFAARGAKTQIGRVTGLDPALPGFSTELMVVNGRLSATDADFVDVIHTCAGYLGVKDAVGHADFYPNGGEVPQPGCGNLFQLIEACSHGRSWKFFAESLTSGVPFVAYRCDSLSDLKNPKVCEKEAIVMGEPAPTEARGYYYVKTKEEAPFVLDIINVDV